MPKLQKYFITDANFDKFYFRATSGLYQSIGSTVTGIYPASAEEQDMAEFAVKNLLRKGLLIKLSATVIVNSKKRSLDLLCNRLVLTTVFGSAIGKTFSITGGSSGEIKSLSQRLQQISRG